MRRNESLALEEGTDPRLVPNWFCLAEVASLVCLHLGSVRSPSFDLVYPRALLLGRPLEDVRVKAVGYGSVPTGEDKFDFVLERHSGPVCRTRVVYLAAELPPQLGSRVAHSLLDSEQRSGGDPL